MSLKKELFDLEFILGHLLLHMVSTLNDENVWLSFLVPLSLYSIACNVLEKNTIDFR